jgi:hypothetical protein
MTATREAEPADFRGSKLGVFMEIVLEFCRWDVNKFGGSSFITPAEHRLEDWKGPIPVIGDHVLYPDPETKTGNVVRKVIRRTFTSLSETLVMVALAVTEIDQDEMVKLAPKM